MAARDVFALLLVDPGELGLRGLFGEGHRLPVGLDDGRDLFLPHGLGLNLHRLDARGAKLHRVRHHREHLAVEHVHVAELVHREREERILAVLEREVAARARLGAGALAAAA